MKTDLIDNRQIRIFISSTFRDMQNERDQLMKFTFPHLRKLAAERDVTLTELDLRWGITEEESKSGKVVDICLREIENSIPFFIGIIGNRYGWVPERKDLGGNVTEHFPSVNEYLAKNLSVTEMEMQFGVLERKEDMHAYFYIKDYDDNQTEGLINESDIALQKLERLKEAVKNSKYPSSTYSDVEDLAKQVESAFINLLNQLFPEGNLTPIEKERVTQRSFMNQLCQNYIKDNQYFLLLDNWIKDWEQTYLVVTGASGLGKSSFLANWIKEKQQAKNKDYSVIYHFVGNGGSLGDYHHVQKVLIEEIKSQFGFQINKSEESSNKNVLSELFGLISASSHKLIIVLDAINQIIDIDDSKQLRWLPSVSKNIKIIFSSTLDDSVMDIFKNRYYPLLTIKPMTLKQRKRFVVEYLASYGKKLKPEQVEKIALDPQNSNSLVLSTLLDELVRFGRFEELDKLINYYLKANSVEEFYGRLLYIYEQELDTLPCIILSHIALSKNGLKETEILSLTKYTQLQWSQFYAIFQSHLINKGGLITFAHDYLRQIVHKRYIESIDGIEVDIRKNISNNLKSDVERNCEEIPYQDFMLKNAKDLYWDIMHPRVFAHLYDNDELELVKYWKYLTDSGYSIRDYNEKAKKIGSFRFYHELSYFCSHYLKDADAAMEFSQNSVSYIEDDDDQIKYLNDLSESYSASWDFEKALSYSLRSLELKKTKDKISDEDLASDYNLIGEHYANLEKYDLALEYVNKALALRLENDGPKSPLTAICYNNLCVILDKIGNSKEALEYGIKSLKIRKACFGENYNPTITTYNNIGVCYSSLGKKAKAIQYYKKALELGIQTYGKYYDSTSECINIGTCLDKQKKYTDACFYYELAYNAHKLIYGEKHSETETYCRLLISEYYKVNNHKKILHFQKELLNYIMTYGLGSNDKSLPYLYNNIGVEYRKLGYFSSAIKYSKKAIQLFKKNDGVSSETTGMAYDRLGLAYQANGDIPNAKKSFQKAIDIFKSIGNSRLVLKTQRRINLCHNPKGEA